MNSSEKPAVGPFLTQRGTGEFNGYRWSLYADVRAGALYDYLYIDDVVGHKGGMGGGGVSHFGSDLIRKEARGRIVRWGENDSAQGLAPRGERRDPNAVYGAVAGPVVRVVVELSDGSSGDAVMLPSGEENLGYFVLVYLSGIRVQSLVALDRSGNELDRKGGRS